MPYVDEKLLARLVDKYGLERQTTNTARSTLWGKVNKEYNQITGNNHSKARLSKKWQNINYTKKVKSGKASTVQPPDKDSFSDPSKQFQPEVLHLTESDLDTRPELSADSGSGLPECKGFAEGPENIWSAGQNALRDLLLYLIQKHNLEEVSNPKTRNELWKRVTKDFHRLSGGIVYVRHEKFTKKWQNWKQYNKSKGKAHPFETCGVLDWDVIKEKVMKLQERAATDETFAAALARESGEDASKIKFGAILKSDGLLATSMDIGHPRITFNDTMDTTSHPRLIEREIFLETLRCEQERFKQIVENGKLEREKLIKETDLVQVQLELAKAELALKQHICQVKGVILEEVNKERDVTELTLPTT